jgi:U3 small nucleolar RNA-associated protein 20
MEIDVDWQPAYHALVVLAKLLKIIPEGSLQDVVTSVSWDNVINLMLYPHAWIRAASTRLLGTFYAALPSTGADTGFLETHPLSREGMIITATNLSIQLRSEHLDLPFSLQIVKNLVFIAKSLHNSQGALVEIVEDGGQSDDSGSEDEEEVSNDEEKEMAEESKTARIARAPLPWLFSKLSYQIKTSHLKRRNSFVAPVNLINHVLIAMTNLLTE